MRGGQNLTSLLLCLCAGLKLTSLLLCVSADQKLIPPSPMHPAGHKLIPPSPMDPAGQNLIPPSPMHPAGQNLIPPSSMHPAGQKLIPPSPSKPSFIFMPVIRPIPTDSMLRAMAYTRGSAHPAFESGIFISLFKFKAEPAIVKLYHIAYFLMGYRILNNGANLEHSAAINGRLIAEYLGKVTAWCRAAIMAPSVNGSGPWYNAPEKAWDFSRSGKILISTDGIEDLEGIE
ncbi:unnamed protein product [Closterium sp. NIES-64]|nr:unnamed protein product [Closterium sp. NIES-64]